MLMVCLFSPKNVRFAWYGGFKVVGYMCVLTKFQILFWDFEITPTFSSVLILMMCLCFLNCLPFERYTGLKILRWSLKFRVTCVSPPNLSFYFGVLRWPTLPFMRVLILVMWLYFLNCSPFGRYRGYDNFMKGR
jgi:hypothetical protein